MTPEKIQEHEILCTELIKKLPNGKWSNEVHRLNWKAHGLDCMIVRQPHGGHLCGYVGVPPGHSLYGYHYDKVDVDVHGGLTYAEGCKDRVCHIPEAGEEDNIWWFGFDCIHGGDLGPSYLSEEYQKLGITMFTDKDGSVYRDIEYVKAQTEHLAEQLAEKAVA